MRKTGVVVHWTGRGYGFIFCEGQQFFLHITNYSQITPPAIGQTVSFELAPSRRPGQTDQAVKVQPVEVEAGVRALSTPLAAEAISDASDGERR